MDRKATCGNWKDRISALEQSTGRGTLLIEPERQDVRWLDVPRASFPLHLGGKWVAIKRHALGRIFYSSDQPGAGSFTIDGLPGNHKGRRFFVFWRRDGDCLLKLIRLVRFIDEARRVGRGADLLLTVSNDTWFGNSLGPPQHLQMAAMRARELGRYMVRATNNGISALIDPQGRLIAQTAQFQAETLQGSVLAFEGTTPFARWGSWPVWLFCLAAVAFNLWRQRSQR